MLRGWSAARAGHPHSIPTAAAVEMQNRSWMQLLQPMMLRRRGGGCAGHSAPADTQEDIVKSDSETGLLRVEACAIARFGL